ncbi:probable cytochrome P450 4s3 [Onthophagus taurus]|uniref:probable cytochrome P450 4s3 n=1 Tax=Onthophagus taurus TaxID=166361 RepID=UPI0039BDCE2A
MFFLSVQFKRRYRMFYLSILTIFVVWIIKKILDYKRVNAQLKDFVSPPGHFLLGNWRVFQNKTKTLNKITKLSREYGPRLRFNCLGLCVLFVTDREFLKLLLGTTKIMNKDNTYEQIEPWLGTGLLTCKKEKWEKTRKVLTPAFHLQVLESYICNFHQPITNLIKKLETYVTKDSFDVYPVITLCTLDVICETAMGTTINAQNNEESTYVKSVKEMLRIVQDRSQSVWKIFHVGFLLSRDYWKQKRALKVLHEFTKNVIDKKRLEKINDVKKNFNEKKKLSFIDLLLEANINDKEIAHEVDTFMFAGHDTTASGISFLLYCLSKHKQVQDKIIDELFHIFGEDDRFPTLQDFNEMQYLNLVIKESLRLYPPVPVYIRSSDVDIELGKWTIPKKVSIAIFPYGYHRNPDLFENPEEFIPERFNTEMEPFTYLSFSLGPRNCIGQKFAIFEMKAIISRILRRFEILPVDGYEPIPVSNVVLGSANGIQIKLKKRESLFPSKTT